MTRLEIPNATTASAVRNRTTRRLSAFSAATLAVVAIWSRHGPASADQPERLLPPLVITGSAADGFSVYGQFDKALLVYDDGQTTRTYPFVDNASSSTRFGTWARTALEPGLKFGFNAEFEWTPYSTYRLNRNNSDDTDGTTAKLRKGEGVMESERYGRIWLGQGSMASDGSAEADLSGTGVAAYSAIADPAGGQLFAFEGGGVSGISVGSAFSNLDGLGRKLRARYDTPSFHGLRLGASFGNDQIDGPDDRVWDVGATYAGSRGDMQYRAATAYAQPPDDRHRMSGSVSALHKPTGLNLTIAAGYEDRPDRSLKYGYGKLGWRPRLTESGTTALAVDLYKGAEFAVAGSDSLSVGLAAVQTLDYYRTDLFANLRWYDFDDPAASYETGVAVLTGARVRF